MTTSLENSKEEIERFLKGGDPSVLCITGEWGVGKTYTWDQVLKRLGKEERLDLTRYSYVSLFGLSSLDDVRTSIFENMEWLDKDSTFIGEPRKLTAKALASKSKKLSELASALPLVGQAFAKARPLYFTAIQNQIVCIDDLERRSIPRHDASRFNVNHTLVYGFLESAKFQAFFDKRIHVETLTALVLNAQISRGFDAGLT